MPMLYEVSECRIQHGNWRVEATDDNSEGECFVTIFCGTNARERAEEYAAWKNNQQPLRPNHDTHFRREACTQV